MTGIIAGPATLMIRELNLSIPADEELLKSLTNVAASSNEISSNLNICGLAGSVLGLSLLIGIWAASLVPTLAKKLFICSAFLKLHVS